MNDFDGDSFATELEQSIAVWRAGQGQQPAQQQATAQVEAPAPRPKARPKAKKAGSDVEVRMRAAFAQLQALKSSES